MRVVNATPAKDSAAARSYDELVAAASAAPTEGWDFSFLAGRIGCSPLPWNYVELAQAAVTEARTVLDLDTGGGETLGEVLGGIPDFINSSRTVVATEPYPPNLPVAAERLGPLGVDVRARIDILPVEDGFADLVLNRHGALDAAEVARVMRPGGRLLTQQIGPGNDAELNAALSAPPPSSGTSAAALVENCSRWGWSSMKRRPRPAKSRSAISERSSTNYGWWPGRFPTSTYEPTAPACVPWTPAFVGMVPCRYGAVECSYVPIGREMQVAISTLAPGPGPFSRVRPALSPPALLEAAVLLGDHDVVGRDVAIGPQSM